MATRILLQTKFLHEYSQPYICSRERYFRYIADIAENWKKLGGQEQILKLYIIYNKFQNDQIEQIETMLGA